MAKVLLVIPPLPERSYPGKFMGPDYLASALLRKGHNVKIIDLDVILMDIQDNNLPEDILINQYIDILKDYTPDVIGITNLSLQNDIANFFAYLSKKVLKDTIIIKGGVHETVGWRYTLELHHNYVDACVIGEGENVIVEIAEACERKKWDEKKAEIKGLAYWDGQKAVFNGPSSPVDINEIIPERLNFSSRYNFDVFNYKKTAQMMTMRGCPFNCNFCSESFLFKCENITTMKGIRMRNLESLEKELKKLKTEGYEAIYFDDSTFTIGGKKRVSDISQKLKEKGFIWGCNTRVDAISDEMIKEMKEAGCVYIFCGVESFVPEILLGINKTKNPKKYLSNVEEIYDSFNKNSISNNVFLIFGLLRKEGENYYVPEKWEDIEYCLEKALKLNSDYLSFNILRLLPGVPFSTCPEYEKVRPTGKNPVHAGHYDLKWYMLTSEKDLRSRHPIYRCFEGCGSVNSVFATPEYAYKIITKAIKLVNEKNKREKSDSQTRIVIDPKAKEFVSEKQINGKIQYEIKKFAEIEPEVKKIKILEYWEKIIKGKEYAY